MKKLTSKQMLNIVTKKLDFDYPDYSVELGDNWVIIAEIFYKEGFQAGKMYELHGEIK